MHESYHAKTLSMINTFIARLNSLKQRLQSLHVERQTLEASTRARLQHLQQLYGMESLGDVKFENWSGKRLDRLLIDYMLRNGYSNSARLLARQKGLEELCDVEEWERVKHVEACIRRESVTEALAWCREHGGMIKKSSPLEFQLRLQQFIELRRAGNLVEARNHATKYLSPHMDTQRQAVLAVGKLLCMPPWLMSRIPYDVSLRTTSIPPETLTLTMNRTTTPPNATSTSPPSSCKPTTPCSPSPPCRCCTPRSPRA